MESTCTTFAPAAVEGAVTHYRPQQPKEPVPPAWRRQPRGLDDQDHLSHHPQHLQEFNHCNNNTNNNLHNQQQQLHTTTNTDDNSDFWTGDPFAGVDEAIGENVGGDFEFDWTALGLDPFGTQLLVPEQPGSGANSSLTTPDLDSLDLLVDPLPEANLFFGDTTVPGLDDPSAMSLASSGDHLFQDSLLSNHLQPSLLDHHHHPHPPLPPMTTASPNAFTTTATSTAASSLRPHPSPTYSSSAGTPPTDDAASGGTAKSSSSTKRGAAESGNLNDDPVAKRQRNTMAARRYRQRRLDRLAELERQLADVTADRDDLKVKLARREAEVGALREVLAARK